MRTLSDFPRTQRNVSLVIRVVVTVLLVAAIGGPVLLRSTTKQMIVFAIDQSESIDAAAQENARQFIAEAAKQAELADAEIRFLPFDRTPHRILSTWPPEVRSERRFPTAD